MNIPLKIAIIKKFRTQADFAQTLGVDESLVSRIIRGRRRLQGDRQQEWADALGADRNDLFGNGGGQ